MSNNNELPSIGIIANPSSLALSIIDASLASGCRVKLVTKDVEATKDSINRSANNSLFSITSQWGADFTESEYFVYVSSLVEKTESSDLCIRNETDNLEKIKSLAAKNKRVLVIFPYNLLPSEKQLLDKFMSELKPYVGVGYIFIGDTYGPGMPLNRNYFFGSMFMDMSLSKKIHSPQKEISLYPIYSQLVGQKVIHNLFSFGPYKSESLSILGEKTSLSVFLDILDKSFSNLAFEFADFNFDFTNPLNGRIEHVAFDRIDKIKITLDWIAAQQVDWKIQIDKNKSKSLFDINKIKKNEKKPIKHTPRSNKSISNTKKTKTLISKHSNTKMRFGYAVFVILFVLTTPFMFLLGSVMLTSISMQFVKSGNTESSRNGFVMTKYMSSASRYTWRLLSNIPVANNYFVTGYDFSDIMYRVADVGLNALDIYEESFEVFAFEGTKVEVKDKELLDELYLKTDKAHRDLQFIQTQLSKFRALSSLIHEFALIEEISDVSDKVLIAKNFLMSADSLLGFDQKKTYLLLLQNNMELRPTGGFIGSIGLITFQDGELINLQVEDVYSIDGQLDGYVKPPEPIEQYLGEATWYLRDANWDPDFPDSAEQIMWFLDKSIDQPVDGVIAIDLEFAKRLLDLTGPIELVDHSLKIDSDNFYQTIQSQVEEEFFPGSRNKASILNSFTRALIFKIPPIIKSNPRNLAANIVSLLNEKHMLVYMNNPNIQNTIASAGWSGEVLGSLTCGENCYTDFVSFNDANVGVNKANYYVNKSYLVTKTIEKGSIKTNAKIVLKNSGQSILDEDKTYKSYLRLLVPDDVIFEKVQIKTGDQITYKQVEVVKNNNRVEGGVYVEVYPYSETSVSFDYHQNINSSFSKSGEYTFSVLKQPGTYSDPLITRISLPENVNMKALPTPSLTQSNVLGYNTVLSEDFLLSIDW